MSVISFFRGLVNSFSASTTPLADGQMLYAKDTQELYFDYTDNTSNALVRRPVKDRSAGKSLTYANDTLSLKDADDTVLSSVSITVDPTKYTNLYIDDTDGHLYYVQNSQMSDLDFHISNHQDLIVTVE